MNWNLSGIVKWFHDQLVALREGLNELRGHAGLQPVASNPVPAEVVAHVAAAGPTIPPRPAFDWSAYKGQPDRVAFYAFATRSGHAPTDADMAAGYAAGVVKVPVTDQSGGDLHNNPNLGIGGAPGWHEGDTLSAFGGADGSGLRCTFQPGVERAFKIKCPALPQGADGFGLVWGETAGTERSGLLACRIVNAAGAVVGQTQAHSVLTGRCDAPSKSGDDFLAYVSIDKGGLVDLQLQPAKL